MFLSGAATLALALVLNAFSIIKVEDIQGNHAKGWWLTHVTNYSPESKLKTFVGQFNTYDECRVQMDIHPKAVEMKKLDEKEGRNAYFVCLSNPFQDSGSDL